MSTNDDLKNETANGTKPVLGVAYCVFDDRNYYSVPQTIRIFNTEEKAINFCKAHPFEKYWWDEMEVE